MHKWKSLRTLCAFVNPFRFPGPILAARCPASSGVLAALAGLLLTTGCTENPLLPGEIFRIRAHPQNVFSLAYSPDGAEFATCGLEEYVRIRNAQTGAEIGFLEGHEIALRAAVYTPDGSRILSCGLDGTVRLWDRKTLSLIHTFAGHEGHVLHCAVSPDGKFGYSGGTDRSVRRWDLEEGEEAGLFLGASWEVGEVFSIAVSPDGSRVAAGCSDKTVRILNASTLRQVKKLEGLNAAVLSVAYSRDGSKLLASGSTAPIIVWDTTTFEEVKRLLGHEGTVRLAIFAPLDRVISASFDRTMRVWDLAAGTEVKRFNNRQEPVYAVAISPDGKSVLLGGFDGSVSRLDLDALKP